MGGEGGLPEPAGAIKVKESYVRADFLCFDDEHFVRNAYRGILRREPEDAALAAFLAELRGGRLSKTEILRQVRHSEEGRAVGVPIRGLESHGLSEPGAPIECKDSYDRADFFRYHDEDFVRNAYRGILRREPDNIGLANFLGELRGGRLSKSEILRQLRYSEEGRALGVRIRGIGSPTVLRIVHRIPFVHRIRGILKHILLLPELMRSHDIVREEIEALADGLASQEALARVSAALQQKVERTHLAVLQKKIQLLVDSSMSRKELAEIVEALQQRTERLELAISRRGMIFQHRRLASLIETASEGVTNAAGERKPYLRIPDESHQLDQFYVSFEDRFRGEAEDIMNRAEVYLPFIREARAGTAEAPILDLGCGRGEWLELLRKNGLAARGVDLNRLMLAQCRERGLDVVDGDVIDYLQSLEPQSLGALTGMHIIEHILFGELVALVDDALRVLKPGGVAIFETPNPENLIVATCGFYTDPTHQAPLPPEPIRFLFETRGFTKVEILRLHPGPPEALLVTGDAEIRERLNKLLYGAQDYAVIAFKS
jgi:O-antigen chain-terminating methyltransferase